jgi:hypothetical protein
MLDWDDVQAVATRTVPPPAGPNSVEGLLKAYREQGATHLSIPELTLHRLLQAGQLSLTQGTKTDRVYLRASDAVLADLVSSELQARLPYLQTNLSRAENPLMSFKGDLPTVAEVGLGFDPAHADLARRAGLSLVARPVGYSWVQPDMIDRTLDQAAALGARIVAVQGNLIPGHEFNMKTTVEAMRRNRLTYAYFSRSRHQKGDWFLAKNLAAEGLVMLAHEFQPSEMLAEDWHTISYRWANLAVEAGIRLCSVRFFRVLHAADPLESVAYVRELAAALKGADLLVDEHAGAIDLTPYQAGQNPTLLAAAGLSIAGAAGLAFDLLPVPDFLKAAGLGTLAVCLTGLPYLEASLSGQGHHHHHDGNDHHHHHHDHDHSHNHVHDHHHHDHGHDRTSATTYASKGLSLAATVAYPAAGLTFNGCGPAAALAHSLAVAGAGAVALTAATTDQDYAMAIEEYRGYNLDWLIPLSLAALTGLFPPNNPKHLHPWRCLPGQVSKIQNPKSKIQNPKSKIWPWLPLAGLGLVGLTQLAGGSGRDWPAWLDREHRHAHTHHLSAFQRHLGDIRLAISGRPLRKWSFWAPLGAVAAALFKQRGPQQAATAATTAAAAGHVASLAGFRNGQRPILKTVEGRARGWIVGLVLAGIVWLVVWLGQQRT